MSNKSRLQINNTNLQELITKANNLPNAGGGTGGGGSSGGIETCTVTISGEVPVLSENIYYIDGTSNYKQVPFPDFNETITITVQKYSLLMSEVFLYPSGDATRINSARSGALVFIYGDATLTGM